MALQNAEAEGPEFSGPSVFYTAQVRPDTKETLGREPFSRPEDNRAAACKGEPGGHTASHSEWLGGGRNAAEDPLSPGGRRIGEYGEQKGSFSETRSQFERTGGCSVCLELEKGGKGGEIRRLPGLTIPIQDDTMSFNEVKSPFQDGGASWHQYREGDLGRSAGKGRTPKRGFCTEKSRSWAYGEDPYDCLPGNPGMLSCQDE